MAKVSEHANLSRGTVYRYFPSKDELLAVLAEYEQDRFAEGLRDTLTERRGTGGNPDLEMVAEYVMGYLRSHPA